MSEQTPAHRAENLHSSGAVSVVEATYAAKRGNDPFPETLLEIEGPRGAIVTKEVRQLGRDRLTFAMMFGVPIMQLLLFGYAFSWIFALIGLYSSSPETANSIGFTLIFPLTFASSVFVPASTMPDGLERRLTPDEFIDLIEFLTSHQP